MRVDPKKLPPSDDEISSKLDEAILKADPKKLTDEELDRRLYLAESAKGMRPSGAQETIQAGKDILGGLGAVLDYPTGIARTAVDSALTKSPTMKEDVIDAAIGNPISSKEFMKNRGVPSRDLIPGIPVGADTAAGLAMDTLGGMGAAQAGGMAAKGVGKGLRALLGGESAAIRSAGVVPGDVEAMIKSTKYLDDGVDPRASAKVQELSNYASDNIIGPFSRVDTMLGKTREKLSDIGSQIGALRKKSESQVEKWISSGPEQEVMQYLQNSFVPGYTKEKIFKQIDEDVATPALAEAIKNNVAEQIDGLNPNISIDKLSQLKKEWADQVKYGANDIGYGARKNAFDYLQRAADDAIDNEIAFADKYLRGEDLAKHAALKNEYGNLKMIEKGMNKRLTKKFTSRTEAPNLNPLSLVFNSKLQSPKVDDMIASLPRTVSPLSVKTTAITSPVIAGSMVLKEPMVGRYPESQTQTIMPQDFAVAKTKILTNSSLSATEKAKRLNLLHEHGRIYLGP